MNMIKKIKPLGYIFLALVFAASVMIIHVILANILVMIFNATNSPFLAWLLSAEDINRFDMLKYPLMIILFWFLYRKIVSGNLPDAESKVVWDIKKGIMFSILIGLGFGGISFLWIKLVENALSGVGFIKQSLDTLEHVSENYSQGSTVLLILTGGVMGPIMEELLFRGIILGLLEKVKKGWFAVIFSALLFGIAHIAFVQVVYTFLMGLIAGAIYLKTRNILWPIIIHITINTVAAISSFAQVQNYLGIWEKISVILIIPALYIVFKTAYQSFGVASEQKNGVYEPL